jgi:hypothetical protein
MTHPRSGRSVLAAEIKEHAELVLAGRFARIVGVDDCLPAWEKPCLNCARTANAAIATCRRSRRSDDLLLRMHLLCRLRAFTAARSRCPNCGGELVRRPIRPADKLARHPASTQRVGKPIAADAGTGGGES